MWWLPLWATLSLYWLVYQADYERNGGSLICMSMNATAVIARNAAKAVRIISPDGSTVLVTSFIVRMVWWNPRSAEPLSRKNTFRRKRWWKCVTFDYFYGQQAELFTFYRVPKSWVVSARWVCLCQWTRNDTAKIHRWVDWYWEVYFRKTVCRKFFKKAVSIVWI